MFRKSCEHLITHSGNNRILSRNNLLLHIFAGLLEILGENTTSDISKLLYLIPRAIRLVKFGTVLKYHDWHLCQISPTNHAIICLYYNLRNLFM